MLREKPILITGTHRSGSTWVGRMLALSSQVGYIYEPFHPTHRYGICNDSFSKFFTYVSSDNEDKYISGLNKCLAFQFNLLNELKYARSLKDIAKAFQLSLHFQGCRRLGKRPLLKDPIAFFSAEWLSEKFDMDVVILIRHPAAFIGSLKKANWAFDFNDFLSQDKLIQDLLPEFKNEIEDFTSKPGHETDLIGQGILLWNIFHSVILKYQGTHPEWIFIRHEDLSDSPVDEFRNLFSCLNLDFSDSTKSKIESFSSSTNPKEQRKVNSVKRDTKSVSKNWKSRLTSEEIKRIKDRTIPVSSHFYDEMSWI